MIKKLLLIPFMGIISFGAFASADTIDGFSSDTEIGSYTLSSANNIDTESVVPHYDNGHFYFCISTDNIPYWYIYDNSNNYDYCPNGVCPVISVSSSIYCSSQLENSDAYIYLYSSYTDDTQSEASLNGKFYFSNSPITYSSSSDDGDSSYIPSIPDSFTSGLTNLLNNFGSTVFNWLPTIILVALGIYAIFALFRVVRNYAKSAFQG